MLSKFDDYPIHQTSQPIAQPATGDRNAYDRYWFNGYQDDGEFYFGDRRRPVPEPRDPRLRPEHRARRRAARLPRVAAGAAGADRSADRPVLDRRARADAPHPGHASTTTRPASPPTSPSPPAPRASRRAARSTHHGPRLVMDVTRFAQFGKWEGVIRYDGRSVPIDRRRSTAPRIAVGACEASGFPTRAWRPTEPRSRQVFFLWAPLHWKDRCTHYGVFEDANANRWHTDGAVLPVYDDPADIPGRGGPGRRAAGRGRARHRLHPRDAPRRARPHCAVHSDGRREDIDLEPLICYRMKGIGYMHPEWGHGMWKGELAYRAASRGRSTTSTRWRSRTSTSSRSCARRAATRSASASSSRSRSVPHARYGFKELLDPA